MKKITEQQIRDIIDSSAKASEEYRKMCKNTMSGKHYWIIGGKHSGICKYCNMHKNK